MNRSLEEFGIDRLSLEERLELIGQIWDSLSEREDSPPMPDWHQRELERRRTAADANPDAAIPWEVVKARLADES